MGQWNWEADVLEHPKNTMVSKWLEAYPYSEEFGSIKSYSVEGVQIIIRMLHISSDEFWLRTGDGVPS